MQHKFHADNRFSVVRSEEELIRLICSDHLWRGTISRASRVVKFRQSEVGGDLLLVCGSVLFQEGMNSQISLWKINQLYVNFFLFFLLFFTQNILKQSKSLEMRMFCQGNSCALAEICALLSAIAVSTVLMTNKHFYSNLSKSSFTCPKLFVDLFSPVSLYAKLS